MISVSGICPVLRTHAVVRQSKQQNSGHPCRVCTVAPWTRWQAQSVQCLRHPLDSWQRAPSASECLSDLAWVDVLQLWGCQHCVPNRSSLVQQCNLQQCKQRPSPTPAAPTGSSVRQSKQLIYQQARQLCPPPQHSSAQAPISSVSHYKPHTCMHAWPPDSPTLQQPATEQARHLPGAYNPQCTAAQPLLHPAGSISPVQATSGSSLSAHPCTLAYSAGPSRHGCHSSRSSSRSSRACALLCRRCRASGVRASAP